MRLGEGAQATKGARRGQPHDAACFCANYRGEDEPPVTSNTGGLNRHEQSAGGIDTLEVWLIGHHTPEFLRVLPELQEAQEYAKSKLTQTHASVTVTGRRVKVHPRGVVKANGTVNLDLRLEWDGIEVMVTSDLPGDGQPIGFVRIGSFRLMRDGHVRCWHDQQQLVEDLGVRIADNLVSRIDACVDLPGVPIALFCEAYARRDFIGRAKSGGLYDEGDGFTGFTRGKGGVVIRVYEKLVEARKHADDAKFEVLTQRRWGGEVPECATRVEFQLRREWLATWSAIAPDGMQGEPRTVEQVFDLLPTLTRYLVEHWFRIVDDAERLREHGNQARAQASELWLRVCEAFASWAEGEVLQLVRRCEHKAKEEALLRQIAGLAASVAAATPESFGRSRDVLASVSRRVDAIAGDRLMDKLKRRRCDLEASGRARWLGVPVEPLLGPRTTGLPDGPAIVLPVEELPF